MAFRKGLVAVSLVFLVLSGGKIASQNLVSNPGFESHQCENWRNSSLENCLAWSSPNLQSPDYFNPLCNKFKSSTVSDSLWWGKQKAFEGMAYSGIIAYRPNNDQPEKTICEYLQGDLLEPLLANTKYHIRFRISLAESSKFSLLNLGVFLSSEKIETSQNNPLHFIPYTLISIKSDTAEWMEASASFTAKGNEMYFVLGVFPSGKKIKMKKVNPSPAIHKPRNEAYYFIDDVAVFAEGTSPDKPYFDVSDSIGKEEPSMKENADTILVPPNGSNTSFILKELYFETGSHIILPESFSYLDKLYFLMKGKPEMKIKITGHTDNAGNPGSNLILSEKRAKAVADYLIEKGIPASQIIYEGKGDTTPIADNGNEQGRSVNRRVEVKILDQ